ncbi:MAG: hypothetical protein M1816_004612 [Peltula sp. TS41687]|nr:MAG: hypothetical protein M1816_004612 [Peltula sp. TS41687]
MEEVLKTNSLLNLVKLQILRIKTLEAYERAARVADPHIQASDPNTVTDRQYTKVLLLNLDRKARARNPASSINNEVVKALVPSGQTTESLEKAKNWIMNTRSHGSRWRLLFQNLGYGLALLISTSITFNKLEKDLTTYDFNIGTPNNVLCTGHHESEDEVDLPELDMKSDSEENQEATTDSGDVMDLDQYGPDASDEDVVMDSDAEGREERSDTEQLIWEAGRKAEREKAERELRKREADDWDRDGDETDNEEDEEEDEEEEEDGEEEEEKDEDE